MRSPLILALLMLAPSAIFAATPDHGTVTQNARTLEYTFPAEPRANASNQIEGTDPAYVCSPNDVPYACDTYTLTVTLPAGYMAAHPNDVLLIEPATTSTQSDIDSQLEDENGTVLTVTRDNPPSQPTIRWRPEDGTHVYLVQIVPGTPHEGGNAKITLVLGEPPPPGGYAYAPRFQTLATPPNLGNDSGEPSIGYNPHSNRGMFQAGLESLRYTFPEHRKDDALNPDGLPEACDAQWEDVSTLRSGTVSLDPIGFVDPIAGRSYAGQLGPKEHNMVYSDDDGTTWSQSVGNFPGAAGVDHQTVGWGPYVPGGSAGPVPTSTYPNAIYYCSQDVAYANCSRSDDGGVSFLPPVPAYTVADCGGLHGHIRGAPDGTVYLPNKSCNNNQAVAVSEDNGVNWEVRRIPDSSSGSTDPQMAVAADGTGYFCYVDGLGAPSVAVTHDRGKTWASSVNLGQTKGLKHAVFAQGIAGDADRAACGFIATDAAGNPDAEDFAGIWYAFIALTYDGGQTWSMNNVTPDDPVQGAGGICTAGTTCGNNRNLLDFNEMTLDDKGHPVLGFADGCIGTCVKDPTTISRSAKAAIARVVGGKSLYASLDRAEPYEPQAACLAGTRSADGSALTWRTPADNGTSSITGYKIYRATTLDAIKTNTAPLVSVTPKNKYTDYSADPAEPEYFYKIIATNALGDSVSSNLIKLTVDVGGVLESACTPPGLTILQDAEGDELDGQQEHDVRKLSLAQPYFANGDYKLYFRLKVASLATVPPNTIWPVAFCSPAFPCVNPDVNTKPYGADNKYYTVQMSTVPPATPAAPAFQILQPTAAGTTAGSRTVINALPESTFSPDGSINIIVKASDIGLTSAGAGADKLSKFQTRVSVNGVAVNPTPDNMPDSLAGAGEYTTTALNFCSPNTPPQALLSVDLQSGPAPLTVTFDASASSDADAQDTVAEYIFDFGDGTENVSQATPVASHTFAADGSFNAKLRVKDSRGVASTTPAAKVIEVLPGAKGVGNNRLGGALPPAGLLVLGAAALMRRRRRS